LAVSLVMISGRSWRIGGSNSVRKYKLPADPGLGAVTSLTLLLSITSQYHGLARSPLLDTYVSYAELRRLRLNVKT
jgi:hypothetical protein